ncbi:type IV pilus modification protein PilV [Ectothiorhodospiraceae bacterium BW-2]|nr:type IV pilus modification protein PilV [Ectothiorhodospiraceae bacterium BW-2]
MIRQQAGFGLIEVLITALILATGLLGLASLQAESLRANHSASLRSQASYFSYDIIDRMRANRQQALNGQYDIALGVVPTGGSVAEVDLLEWKMALAATLPLGDGAVERSGSQVTVTIQWDDSRGRESLQQFDLDMQL